MQMHRSPVRAARTRLEAASCAARWRSRSGSSARWPAGRSSVDGQTLATDTQLALRLQKLAREAGAETLPIPEGRARGPAATPR